MRFVAVAFFAGFLFISYLFAASATAAHHSLRAYDANTALTVTGTVSQYEWRNPHIQIYLSAPELDENEEVLIFEGANIGRAERLGWSVESFRSGEAISVSYNPFWTLLTKVETSCDRILIAGGANVEAEWEQGPAV